MTSTKHYTSRPILWRILVIVLLLQSLAACEESRPRSAASNEDSTKKTTLTEEKAISWLLNEYNGIKYPSFNRDFSYRIEDKFRNRVMVAGIHIRDISYVDENMSLIIGSNINSVFKIYLSNEHLSKADTLKPSFHRYAVAIEYVRVKKLFELESEPDDEEQLGVHPWPYGC